MSTLGLILTSVLVSTLITMAVLKLWLSNGALIPLDVASDRSLHAGAIPRIGGASMGIGVSLGLTLAMPLFDSSLGSLLFVAGGLFLMSLIDDWRSLHVLPRLMAHLAAAGIGVISLQLPLSMAIFAALYLIWMTNLYNFMDGADGLAGGMAIIGFGTYALAAWSDAAGITWVSSIIVGSAAGFMVFNIPPARVFMGDAGSIPLGFLSGAMGLAGWHDGVWPLWFPLLIFSPFIADATSTLWQRLWRRERIWQAHREHHYQRLILMGWSHRKLALAAWGVMVGAAGSALWLRGLTPILQWGGVIAWILIYSVAFREINQRWRHATLAQSLPLKRSS
jgi:UDP-N-acetylmuramyl pentapeptide phosphotransferase/UDP-N-acetylglucosamine-1-phosphate transferase